MMEDSFLGVKLTRNPPPPDPLGEHATYFFTKRFLHIFYSSRAGRERFRLSEAVFAIHGILQ